MSPLFERAYRCHVNPRHRWVDITTRTPPLRPRCPYCHAPAQPRRMAKEGRFDG